LRVAGVIKDWPTRSVPLLPQKVIAPDDLIDALPLFNCLESSQARNTVNQSCSGVRQRPRVPPA
jgi:hypothetical protein